MSLFLRLPPWAAALALAFAAAPAWADPFTVEHLLRTEAFGAVRVSPDERTVLFERQGPYETADRFDLGYFGPWTTSEVWVADRTDPTVARPLLGEVDRRGVVLGEFSPDGRRLVVHRLQADRWETGVVALASGAVRWLGLGAEPPVKGETTLWRTDDELILTARVDGDLPYEIGALATGARNSRDWRAAAARGGVAATVWSAGDLADPLGPSARLATWRIDLRTGRRTLLAQGQTLDMALSWDGRWLAIVDRGAPEPVDPDAPLRPSDPAEARRLTVVRVDTGEAWRPCGDCNVASGLLGWSEDDRLLVWDRARSDRAVDGRLLAIAPETRAVAALDLGGVEPDVGSTRDAGFGAVRAAWVGADAVLLARRPGEARADWYRAGPRPALLTQDLSSAPGGLEAVSADGFLTIADGALWSVDRAGRGSRLPGPAGLSAVSTLTPWASPRRRLNAPPERGWTLARAPDGALWRLGADGSSAPLFPDATSRLRAAGETLAVDAALAHGVETLRLLRPGQEPTPLAVVNAGDAAVDFATPLPVTTPGAPEDFAQSWLYSPPGGLVPGTPVVVVAYPGASVRPATNPAEFSTMANVQLLAGLGYAVLTPALPGTGADGPAAHLTDRILATLDAALARYPELDGDRVAYLGHSFGGYTGLVLATETRRIRSYVIMSATADLAAGWGGFGGFLRSNPEFGALMLRRNAGWSEAGQGGLGAPPWGDPQAYVAASPLFRADRIAAPVLLIHGETDFVGVHEAEAVFTALWRQNKDARLVTYWGEQHLFYSPGAVRDLWARIDDWLGRTIGRSPARLTDPPVAPPSDGPRLPATPPPGFPSPRPASEGRPHPVALPSTRDRSPLPPPVDRPGGRPGGRVGSPPPAD